MAKNIIITVNAKTKAVRVDTKIVGVVGENLQGNFIVEFDGDEIIAGAGFLEIESGGEKGYIELTPSGKTYTAPIKSGITKYNGRIDAQVRITQAEVDGEIPVFKSDTFTFSMLESINAIEEITDEYPEWIDIANSKLAEIDKIEFAVEKRVSLLEQKVEEEFAPKRLSLLPALNSNVDRKRVALYADYENQSYKVTMDKIGTQIKTVTNKPSDMQVGDYIFLEKGE